MNLQQHAEYHSLLALAKEMPSLQNLFADDSHRVNTHSIEQDDFYFDYSKQRVNETVKSELLKLANSCQLTDKITALLSGHAINNTENRPALHSALRMPVGKLLIVQEVDVNKQVHDSLGKMTGLIKKLRQGNWVGFTGKTITDVVNIGVGGSDLGPVMACDALRDWADTEPAITVHFVSKLDGSQLNELIKYLNPETTLFILCSKSFTTSDTFGNADTAISWMCAALEASVADIKNTHFIGISSQPQKMRAWGLPVENQLVFWDWVGGRYSLCSTIGFSIALSIGVDNFYEFLAGAHEMDEHFSTARFADNLPVMMGLLGIWNSTFLDIRSHAVLPYDGRLKYFPDYLTQLEMESNGKKTTLNGENINYRTCPIIWGGVGTKGQHAFYQLLHQGTEVVSCDFIATVDRYQSGNSLAASGQTANFHKLHQKSLMNCFAQSRVLAFGNAALDNTVLNDIKSNDIDLHKSYRGNQPSTTLLMKELTPRSLGKLIALYEHKVFVMSVIWDINPFDQWGVEIGKVIANQLQDSIASGVFDYDTSTNELLKRVSQ